MRLADGAKTTVKRAARSMGLSIRRLDARDFPARRVRLAARHSVGTVLDVGANAGYWAKEMRRYGYRGSIVSFEPLTKAFAELEKATRRDHRWHALRLALGASSGTMRLNVAGNSWSSSLLEMAEAHRVVAPDSAYVGSETVRVATLDEVCCGRVAEAERVYVKLDVQGFEMEVLRGAGRTLQQTDVVEMELSLVPLYEGQVLYGEAIERMDQLGFALVGLDEGFTDADTGRLLQFDALFESRATDDRRGET